MPGENPKKSTKDALIVPFKMLDKKAEGWIQAWNPYNPEVIKTRPIAPVAVEESKIRRSAARIFFIAFSLFLLWALFAPIDAGVTTQGTVMVSGYRKTLQHSTGGIVQEIRVKDGDVVKEGDILIRINPLKAEAEFSNSQLQYIGALVTEARLKAELVGDSKITWPSELSEFGKDSTVEEAKKIQQKLFETRRSEILSVLDGKRRGLATLSEEAKNSATLAAEGYVSRAQASQVMRNKIDSEMQLKQMESTYYKDINTQLADIQKARDGLKDRLQAVSLDRDLTAIRSPVSGTVMGLKVNTIGGTVPAGQILAEIVPSESTLVVDAQVPPHLIDRVKQGEYTDMHFTAFNANTTPVISGKVIMVSADKLPVQQAGQQGEFYLAKVEATKEGMEKLGNLKIEPGMPVDVIFKTGERTFMSYLIKPLSDRFVKAFKD
jgi:protease secretion system membrane fusion protein